MAQICFHQEQAPEEDKGIGVVGGQIHIDPFKFCQAGILQGLGIGKGNALRKQGLPVGTAEKNGIFIAADGLAKAVQQIAVCGRIAAFVVNDHRQSCTHIHNITSRFSFIIACLHGYCNCRRRKGETGL